MRNSTGSVRHIIFRKHLGALAFTIGALFIFPASAQINLQDEIECLALTIYFEARGEPLEGKIAVGYVVMNRVKDSAFPKTVCGVVHQGGAARLYRCQFTWWCDRLSDKPPNSPDWRECQRLARLIYDGRVEDPTQDSLWYHADYVAPNWAEILDQGPIIGRHIFYSRAEPVPPARTPDKIQIVTSTE